MSRNSKDLKQKKPWHASGASIAILAGGLSQRFGRDKSLLRAPGGTLLQNIRAKAQATGYTVHVIRKDRVARCGPLGGILTAFARTPRDPVLFLACDMPAVSSQWMGRVIQEAFRRQAAVFTVAEGRCGFPCVLWRQDLEVLQAQRSAGQLSLRSLADSLQAHRLTAPPSRRSEFININTPSQWREYLSGIRGRDEKRTDCDTSDVGVTCKK